MLFTLQVPDDLHKFKTSSGLPILHLVLAESQGQSMDKVVEFLHQVPAIEKKL